MCFLANERMVWNSSAGSCRQKEIILSNDNKYIDKSFFVPKNVTESFVLKAIKHHSVPAVRQIPRLMSIRNCMNSRRFRAHLKDFLEPSNNIHDIFYSMLSHTDIFGEECNDIYVLLDLKNCSNNVRHPDIISTIAGAQSM
ncbi:hypothetical protein RF11_15447 [Thelohanellus kitauei]|uniref:Uncharacterized protein n=1 Tax=Thelohanellus kitauei TaxID=669202 RepID=A0A0C2JJK7_THEKT|nr:hypothetical protein RF11_15447 [Thelohanellus kitauei]